MGVFQKLANAQDSVFGHETTTKGASWLHAKNYFKKYPVGRPNSCGFKLFENTSNRDTDRFAQENFYYLCGRASVPLIGSILSGCSNCSSRGGVLL
jgi:hypothetical protein